MYILVEEYMLKSREDRMRHLDLKESCIEIGGSGSKEYKGLLAHALKTTIPTNTRKINLCHACNNQYCSNTKHLYWGTPKDNMKDQIDSGNLTSIFERTVKKYGREKALEFSRPQNHSNRIPSNGLNKEDLKRYDDVLKTFDRNEYGWKTKAAKQLNISHTHVSRLIKRLYA